MWTFYRKGKVYSKEDINVYDHDFPSFSDWVIIPHWIYDVKRNEWYINIWNSRDTSEFAIDCIEAYWNNKGKFDYPKADSILILCDWGGSNSSRHYIFKEDLLKLWEKLKIKIRIAHYPPYVSKYNPIEHRLFPHITRACQGVVFSSLNIVKQLIEKTKTTKGLSVMVNIIDKVYETWRKVAKDFKENILKNSKISFFKSLPKWNYIVNS